MSTRPPSSRSSSSGPSGRGEKTAQGRPQPGQGGAGRKVSERAREPESSEPRSREPASEEPRWITRTMLDAMHADLLRRHGGLPGVNADGLISLALARPRDRWATKERRPDLPELAASYAYALSKNEGYRDCNRRVALMAAYVFLGLNGLSLVAPDDETVYEIVHNVASSGPEALASWLREHTVER